MDRTNADPDRHARLDAVLAGYLQSVEQGDAPDRQEMLNRHPDLAAELHAFFEGQENFARIVRPLRVAASSIAREQLHRDRSESDMTRAPRFTAGQLLAGRYRIVSAIGSGGMGEVYRAEDLTLKQTVALKFLPPQLTGDADRLERLRGEVSIARQISHPNVCRVYDIAEAEGQTFLTMEYIDGQNLADLLKQVGRFPEDRGVELARQLCLGLAAIHDRGALHRDLKPHNVMIDSRGHIRITDFGLSSPLPSLLRRGQGEGLGPDRSGTPAYMAPEQLSDGKVSIQSDL